MKTQHELTYDVVVIGGGPGGFPAAIAAARQGAKTLLVERNAFLGGAATSGLGNLGYLDRSGDKALGGIPLELIERLERVGGAMGSYPCPVHNSITPVSPDWVKIVASQMCKEASVDVLYNTELTGVAVRNGRLHSVTLHSKAHTLQAKAKVFIDGTGDGEAAYLARCRFHSGQADGAMQPGTLMFTLAGHDLDALFAYLEQNPEDYGIKESYAKGYHLDFFRKTPGHCFIGLQQLIAKARANGDFDVPRNQFIYITTPSKKLLSVNTSRLTCLDATDPFALSQAITTGYEQVAQIVRFLNRYVPGFESAVISQISPTFGIRETRHFVGQRTLCFSDLYAPEVEKESIGRCAYNIDIHSAKDDTIDLTLIEKSFGIPYGCLVPEGMEGLLLSGRTISVDEKVYAACRVMGPCMAIAQAAGTAAARAAQTGEPLAKLSVSNLRETLQKAGAVL